MSKTDNLDTKKRGIYLLPNLLTTASLFSGFYAIVSGINGRFEPAVIAIFISMILDALDGRVARLTGTQSNFGAQYDSMADMACFGVTPALVIYNWGLSGLGKLGWLIAFIYTATTALRLARFNSQPSDSNKYFTGLPCPMAAAIIAAMIWIMIDFDISGKNISMIIAGITLTVSLLMVSNVKYLSFKQLDVKEHVSFLAILVAVLMYALIAWDPPKVLFIIFVSFVLSGPILWLKNLIIPSKK